LGFQIGSLVVYSPNLLTTKKNNMKHSLNFYSSKLFLFAVSLLSCAIVFAQDSSVATTTTSTSATSIDKTWYMEPWAWVLGGVILLVIILLATRSSSNTTSADKVTVTKTVTRDSEII